MIFWSQWARTAHGETITFTTDINLPVGAAVAFASISGFGTLGPGGTGVAGFTQYVTVDPQTGARTTVDLSYDFLGCSPIFSPPGNVESMTFMMKVFDQGGQAGIKATGLIMSFGPGGI